MVPIYGINPNTLALLGAEKKEEKNNKLIIRPLVSISFGSLVFGRGGKLLALKLKIES